MPSDRKPIGRPPATPLRGPPPRVVAGSGVPSGIRVGKPPVAGTRLVGSLPWEKPAELEPPAGPPPVPGMPVVVAPPPAGGLRGRDQEEPPAPLTPRERLEAWIQQSPPFSVSLSLHVVVLLVLAIIFYPRKEPETITLDLSFASETVVEEDEEKGVQIVAQTDPEEEPEEEIAETEEPPVEDPIAAPVMVEEVVDTGVGAAAEPVPERVAVGSLLDGRQEGRREALVRAFGGSDATEAAVARALAWLADQQRKDGLWSLKGPYPDGGSQENELAATAMALLAFQGAGNTPLAGRHKEVVARGWEALAKRQSPDGRFAFEIPSHHSLYAHAQATYAACELLGMTGDERFAEPARLSLAYALAAQGPNGGWRYAPGEEGDMSVSGWFMMALKSGEMAGLAVPPEASERLTAFLDTVAVRGGSQYGYRLDSPKRPPTGVTPAVTAEGLLSRQFLGWPRDDGRVARGLEVLFEERFLDFDNDKDVYAWYYITQVAHNVGGPAWERWNGRMREVVPAQQSDKGSNAGSWDPSLDKWGHIGGRLFTTCFCTYMLEVYYRHLPLYQAVAAE